MATVRMPSSLHAQITRSAISPRLAIRIFLNMKFSFQLSAFATSLLVIPSRARDLGLCWSRQEPRFLAPLGMTNASRGLWKHKTARIRRAARITATSRLRPYYEQFLTILNVLAVVRQLFYGRPIHFR